MRWILPGQLDAAIASWFGRFPARLDSREDAYLIHPVLRAVHAYERTRNQLDAIYASERLKLPFEGVLLIGY